MGNGHKTAKELIAARNIRLGRTKPNKPKGKWKPGDPKYPAWVGTGGSGSNSSYLLKGNTAMKNWIDKSKQRS